MPQDSRRAVARAHIAATVFGWGIEPARLTNLLIRGCWPGALDGARPVQRGWVRRLEVEGLELAPPICECSAGTCLICN